MGNVASVGLVKESGFTTTKSLLDFNTNEIKYDLNSKHQAVEHAENNINRKLSADCIPIMENELPQSDSPSDSSFAIPSLLSMIGLTGTECNKLLYDVTAMNITQAACDATEQPPSVKAEPGNLKVNRNKKMMQQNGRAMPAPTRKNGYVAQIEENNLCVFNFMWVCSYGSFTAVPRAYNRLSRNRSVPPPSSPLMKAVKSLSMQPMSATESPLTRISGLSRRSQANAYRSRHMRRTQLQAPLSAADVAKAKLAQSSSEMPTIDTNNNDNASENKENSAINSISSNINTNSNTKSNSGINTCGSKANGKSKIPVPTGATTVPATVTFAGRKLPTFAQQPPQKFKLGTMRNRKQRNPLTTQKTTTIRRQKSHTISVVQAVA